MARRQWLGSFVTTRQERGSQTDEWSRLLSQRRPRSRRTRESHPYGTWRSTGIRIGTPGLAEANRRVLPTVGCADGRRKQRECAGVRFRTRLHKSPTARRRGVFDHLSASIARYGEIRRHQRETPYSVGRLSWTGRKKHVTRQRQRLRSGEVRNGAGRPSPSTVCGGRLRPYPGGPR